MDKDEKKIREYESVVGLMRDTGESIWLINTAYVIALPILIWAFLELLFLRPTDAAAGQHTAAHVVVVGSILGLWLVYLWAATFKRNYTFYNLRIYHARLLESDVDLGFSLLTQGKRLSDGCPVTIGDNEALKIPWWACSGIEGYTQCMILIYGLMFVGLLVISIMELNR